MRVLVLRRQRSGSTRALTDALPAALDAEGIEVVVDDADNWIPDKTGFRTDREVSKTLKRAAQGFDLVHAWGYRTAWACSEALYLRFPWVYTAYDSPKTTHSELVDRLNAARRGLCSSHYVKQKLDEADTLNLDVIVPGVPVPADPSETFIDKTEARSKLGLRDDAVIIAAVGRFVPERGFDALVSAFDNVRYAVPKARLFISGSGPHPPPIHQEGIEVRGPLSSVWPLLRAADLVVVPSRRCGFSLVGAESMTAGAPVLFRNVGGMPDMAEAEVNAFFFNNDDDLSSRIIQVLELEMTRETVAKAGQMRAESRFKFVRYARQLAEVYRDSAGA